MKRKSKELIEYDPHENFIPNNVYGPLTKLNLAGLWQKYNHEGTMECSVWNLQSLKTSAILSKYDERTTSNMRIPIYWTIF